MNSLPAEPGFAALLEASFALMCRECPEAYAGFCRLLAPYEVSLTIGTEMVAVRFQSDGVEVLRVPDDPIVHLVASKQTLLDLADARYTLEGAIMQDYLHVRGQMDLLIRFYESLQIYIHGAVRSPSFPGLLNDYRLRG